MIRPFLAPDRILYHTSPGFPFGFLLTERIFAGLGLLASNRNHDAPYILALPLALRDLPVPAMPMLSRPLGSGPRYRLDCSPKACLRFSSQSSAPSKASVTDSRCHLTIRAVFPQTGSPVPGQHR